MCSSHGARPLLDDVRIHRITWADFGDVGIRAVASDRGLGVTNGLISPVHFRDVIPLDLLDTIHGEPSSEGDLYATSS